MWKKLRAECFETGSNIRRPGVFIPYPMTATPHRPGRAGSARFDTYYKVQWYDDRTCALALETLPQLGPRCLFWSA
jgi:hypothetical protein